MPHKGNGLNNAVMENFFGLLKTELLYLQDFDSLEHFKAELIDYLLRHTAKSHRGRSLIRRESLNDVPCEQIFDHIEILNITPPHIGQKKTKNDQKTIN